jgi:hypothetical protein
MITTYLKAGLALLSGAGIVSKLIAGGVIVAALLTAYGVWHHKVYKQGVDAAIAGIAREDERWINRAFEARGKLKECNATGRGWDQTTGRCQ